MSPRFTSHLETDDYTLKRELRSLLIHNPHCPYQIAETLWRDGPQMIVDGPNQRWSDESRILAD